IGPASFMRAALSADSRLLASYDEVVPLWDVASGKTYRTLHGLAHPLELALSPDGRYLAAVWNDRSARRTKLALLETASGQEVYQWKHEVGPRTIVILASSDRLLAAGCLDGSIRLWNLESGMEVGQFTGHCGAVLALAFTTDGQRLVSGNYDTTALLWDLRKV